ncbi:MAG: FAD-dependent oxidoreductase, partial [Carboxylicivirga sp.]|nr:FAD-dependent oxidoreductase [Carboxylicivirga sp.]
MKRILVLLVIAGLPLLISAKKHHTLLIETESFDNKGGWVIDQQFMDEMGSPYLMAHGLGKPVKDAQTTIQLPASGTYYIHVRTKNWAARWSTSGAPGQFKILINSKAINKVFGTKHKHWSWIKGGKIAISQKNATLTLRDLTGFNGRCDAIVLTTNPDFIPPNEKQELAAFRQNQLKLPKNPQNAGKFDLVVVGGGMGGICTAISAARNGIKVALIQNRPVLGGNNSSEVRVHMGARIRQEPWPNLGNLVNEISPVKGGNAQPKEYYEDDKKLQAVLAEKKISLFLNHHANDVKMQNGKIKSVIAQNIETGEKFVFNAPLFADCTGDGTIGALAGAEFMSGRESKAIYNESRAPEKADSLMMGASVQWFAQKREQTISFPDIDWGIQFDNETYHPIRIGDWDWETGMGIDMTKDFERVRDYGMLVVFSNWSYIKNHSKEKEGFANEELQWVAYVAGKRESRRLLGDYVLTENDLVNRKIYDDGTAPTTWSIDLHYPHPENMKHFPEYPFRSIAKHTNIYPYPIPYRCLYSKNIENLMMAGRNISVSHVALGTVRLMRTIGMMGEVLGMAAAICKEEKTTPRGVYNMHFDKLEALMDKGVGRTDLPNTQRYNVGGSLK